MEHFLHLAKSRYTTKKYNHEKQLSAEQIAELKEILRLSPSSINSQPWKFIFISDPATKNRLAEVSYFNEPKIKDASHLVVFTVLDSVTQFEEQIQQNLPEGSVAYYNQHLKPLTDAEIKAWMGHQVYLSLGFFLSACAASGIDSTPMEGIRKEEYDQILELNGYKTLFAVALGYRSEEDANQPSRKPKSRLNPELTIVTI